MLSASVVTLALGGIASPTAATEAPVKVAVIVGPVGATLTPEYIRIGEQAAIAAEQRGAVVARAYSPAASASAVLAAVDGANIVVYLGHGVGTPNPYSPVADPATVNGWGLNGPNARGDHSDSWADGTLAYYGEAWLAANANPAPGFVMIYSNACYAPGAGEGFDAAATEAVAAARVGAYSRGPLLDLGASAYFATDFYAGAAELVGLLIDRADIAYAEIFAAESRYNADAVARLDHPAVDDAETWLQRSAYFEGRVDYWYAFAGNPAGTFAGARAGTAIDSRIAVPTPQPTLTTLQPDAGVVVGLASHYENEPGWEGRATVALPAEIGGGRPDGTPPEVLVCADLCILLPVVDACPCYVGTSDQRVANLSAEAWRQVSARPLSDGLLPVEIYVDPLSPPDLGDDV